MQAFNAASSGFASGPASSLALVANSNVNTLAIAAAPRSALSAGAFDGEVGKTAARCLAYYVSNPCKGRRHVTAAESKDLQKGTRVCWQGNVADRGTITQTSWDAVTITWDNGHVAIVHHGDMREIERAK